MKELQESTLGGHVQSQSLPENSESAARLETQLGSESGGRLQIDDDPWAWMDEPRGVSHSGHLSWA